MIPRLKNYPTEGAMTIANGATYEINLGKNSANFLRVSQANASFRIRIDDTYEISVSAGKKFNTLPDKFGRIEVINDSGGNLTFLLEIGTGDITSDEVVLSGTSNVADAAVLAAVQALDTNMQAALEEVEVEINDVMTLMQNDELLRNPLTTLSGATIANVVNATTTIVTGAANVNGVIIRFANIYGGSNVTAYLQIGAVRLINIGYTAGGCDSQTIRDVFVPAGNQIIISGGNTTSGGNIAYEVL